MVIVNVLKIKQVQKLLRYTMIISKCPYIIIYSAVIGPFHDPVTWYRINYRHAGTQVTQWHFQNKGTRTSPVRLSLFWKSHCVTCVKALFISCHVTWSCKGPIIQKKQHSNSPQLFFRAVRAKIVPSRLFLSSDTEYLHQKYNEQMKKTVNKRQNTWWRHRFTFYLSKNLSLTRLHYASICDSLMYYSAESKSLTGTQSARELRTKGVKFTPQLLLGKYEWKTKTKVGHSFEASVWFIGWLTVILNKPQENHYSCMWNTLDPSLKLSKTLQEFKRKLKNFLLKDFMDRTT